MLRFSPAAVGACASAGTALWFTRASLDVVAARGGELRVAMFPSGVELVALIVFALIAAVLCGRLLARVAGRRGARPVEPLFPLYGLLCLGLPYLPWVPDAVPAIRALAGPARFGVWAIVLGQVGWLTWEIVLRPERRDGTARARARAAAPALAVAVAGFLAASAALADGPLRPSVSEARYLLAAKSLVDDRDFDVENNYAQGDHRAFAPHAPEPAQAGRVMPGLPLLIAPALAAGGYRGVAAMLALLAAVIAAVAWRWTVLGVHSSSSAAVGWMGAAGAAPFVLASGAVSPSVAAAGLTLAVIAWTPDTASLRGTAPGLQGLCAGLLVWLAPELLPLGLALASIAAARQPTARSAVLALLSFAAAAGAAVLPYREVVAASLDGRTDPGGAFARVAGLAVDQEFGLLPVAPAAALAAPGLLRMWQRRGEERRRALEIAAAVLAAFAGAAWQAGWTAQDAGPAQPAAVVLPLLALPIAAWDRDAAGRAALRWLGRVLVLAGLVTSAAFVTVQSGLLSMNRRDGTSRLLEWLAPSNDLVHLVPSVIAPSGAGASAGVLIVLWFAAGASVVWLLQRLRLTGAGASAPFGLLGAIATALLVAAAAPMASIGGRSVRDTPSAAAESSMLSTFDARARPAAVLYDRWRRVPAEAVPALFTFAGRPGLRRNPQPIHVLMNTRLALPAGEYEVALQAREPVDGAVSLQIGRMGAPLTNWRVHADPGTSWREHFTLHVDASFVGFRAGPDVEAALDGVLVRPVAILNSAERLDRHLGLPPVLAASRYGGVTVYFHGAGVFPEADGFWVRGASTLTATLARETEGGAAPVTLRVHTGPASNRVRFRSGPWSRTIAVQGGEEARLEVPLLQGARLAVIDITPESGFVPADTTGGSDRRLLGCWIEVRE